MDIFLKQLNFVLLTKNFLRLLTYNKNLKNCLQPQGFHAMPFFNAMPFFTELFQVCLVVSQTLGEGALVQMFCWYVREKWRSQFSLMVCDDCLKVCFVGLVSGRKDLYMVPCHSCHIYGIWKSRSKKVWWGCLKVIIWGWQCKSQNGGSFHREGRFSLCNTAVL